jgi:hypothetical protein
VIAWHKDVARTIDYLETRPDLRTDKLAYQAFFERTGPCTPKSAPFRSSGVVPIQPRLARNRFRSETQSDPSISSVHTSIMIASSNSPAQGSGLPNRLLGCSAARCSGLSPRADQTSSTAVNPTACATSSTDERLVGAPSLLGQSLDSRRPREFGNYFELMCG